MAMMSVAQIPYPVADAVVINQSSRTQPAGRSERSNRLIATRLVEKTNAAREQEQNAECVLCRETGNRAQHRSLELHERAQDL